MKEVGYETVAHVLETWDTVRRAHKDDFEKEFGNQWVEKYVVSGSAVAPSESAKTYTHASFFSGLSSCSLASRASTVSTRTKRPGTL
jgi:hypothetical protein